MSTSKLTPSGEKTCTEKLALKALELTVATTAFRVPGFSSSVMR
jgi:hypothetical protein